MIRINDEYVIDSDDMNYILKRDRHKKDKKGNKIFTTLGYYNTLSGAIRGLLEIEQKKICSSGEISLDEALRALSMAQKKWEGVLRECVKETL